MLQNLMVDVLCSRLWLGEQCGGDFFHGSVIVVTVQVRGGDMEPRPNRKNAEPNICIGF